MESVGKLILLMQKEGTKMDFNIENLSSGALGGVGIAATAIVNEGGLFGGIAGEIARLAAVVGAVADIANILEDGKIDEDEVERFLDDISKLMVGACIFPFSFGLSESKSDDEEEIWLPPVLYDYDKDSEKYSIASQNLLVDLSKRWFDAKTLEERKKIERSLIYYRANNPSDNFVEQELYRGLNNLFGGGLVGGLLINSIGANEEILGNKIGEYSELEGGYIYDALNDDTVVMAGTTRRVECVGRTPGKTSSTGKKVIARMVEEGNIEVINGKVMFKAGDGEFYELKYGDMAHKEDAVKWWNKNRVRFAEKAPEVRKWMLDPDNYYIEHYHRNRSEGAKIGKKYKYKPSLKPPKIL